MLYLLPQAIDIAAERDPTRDAIRYSGASLTYEALSVRATRLARVLRERGVRRGDRVGIYANKGLDAATAIYGIMKAGAAYVPLDPSAPLGRTELIVRDCGIRHLVSEPSKSGALEALLEAGVALDSVIGADSLDRQPGLTVGWEDVDGAPQNSNGPVQTEMDLAYVLYTSGSTGVPKGVVHTHHSALSFARVAAHTYGFCASDRITNHAPLHFDLSTLDYFATAVAGATTVVIPEGHTKLPASLSKLLEQEQLTVLYAVPLALAHLLLYGALEKRDLTRLRWVLFGGEPFVPKHLRELMRHLPAAMFSNVYGPTEVNGVTYWVVPPLPEDSEEPIPIGKAYKNVDLLVAGENDEEVPSGETGELWVRSPTMMQGYWGRADLDVGAFAFRNEAGPKPAVYHRTGDLVRQDSHGVLHFLGRKDRQIKTRGYRVELDEVESVLSTHAAVETAAVFGVPDAQGSSAIEAAVVLGEGQETTVADLLAHARALLPAYALPEHLAITVALPRTSTDKIDRVTLKAEAVRRRAEKGLKDS